MAAHLAAAASSSSNTSNTCREAKQLSNNLQQRIPPGFNKIDSGTNSGGGLDGVGYGGMIFGG